MKASRMVGAIVAVVLASGAALYAQRGSLPEMKPGGASAVQNDEPQDKGGPGAPDMRPGRPPNEPIGGHPGPQGGAPMMPDPERLRKAGATEQQIETLTEFMFEQQVKRIDQRASAEKAELALERLMRAASPEEKAVAQAVDALNQARGELLKSDVALRMKLKQVLGESVLRKLQEQGPRDRMGRGGAGPGGSRHAGPERAQPNDQHPPMNDARP